MHTKIDSFVLWTNRFFEFSAKMGKEQWLKDWSWRQVWPTPTLTSATYYHVILGELLSSRASYLNRDNRDNKQLSGPIVCQACKIKQNDIISALMEFKVHRTKWTLIQIDKCLEGNNTEPEMPTVRSTIISCTTKQKKKKACWSLICTTGEIWPNLRDIQMLEKRFILEWKKYGNRQGL